MKLKIMIIADAILIRISFSSSSSILSPSLEYYYPYPYLCFITIPWNIPSLPSFYDYSMDFSSSLEIAPVITIVYIT
jgi:hypothetical protein